MTAKLRGRDTQKVTTYKFRSKKSRVFRKFRVLPGRNTPFLGHESMHFSPRPRGRVFSRTCRPKPPDLQHSARVKRYGYMASTIAGGFKLPIGRFPTLPKGARLSLSLSDAPSSALRAACCP